MAKNRRHQSGAVWFLPALKAFLLCLLLGGTAVGYVYQKNRIYELGRQITARETRLERLKWENKLRAGQLADMQLPHKLAERVREQRLGLVPPQPGQVVWLAEPRPHEPTNTAPTAMIVKK
jgi:hypothetical protein